MTENKKCSDCRWYEIYNGCPICGYIAEVYHIASAVHPDANCQINRYEKMKDKEKEGK